MTKNTEKHNRQVWERFWQERQEIGEVYSNSDRLINQILSLRPPKDLWIMEVGAGSGRDGLRLAEMGANLIFLDYAESSLRTIQGLANSLDQDVNLIRADAFHLPFQGDTLDVIFHQGLLEHFHDPTGILKENYRTLKSDGYAVADVPQRFHPYTVVKHILIRMNKWFAGWETEFSPGQLEGLFKECGFTIKRTYGEWMRPSFFYRSLREALKKISIKLPLYPPRMPILSGIRNSVRERLLKTRAALYTVMDVGVIGRK
jgi:ubiquinone/menaquinone biosynthesis C-methylase UbiE